MRQDTSYVIGGPSMPSDGENTSQKKDAGVQYTQSLGAELQWHIIVLANITMLLNVACGVGALYLAEMLGCSGRSWKMIQAIDIPCPVQRKVPRTWYKCAHSIAKCNAKYPTGYRRLLELDYVHHLALRSLHRGGKDALVLSRCMMCRGCRWNVVQPVTWTRLPRGFRSRV